VSLIDKMAAKGHHHDNTAAVTVAPRNKARREGA
jgi:hypothetical protein